MQRASKSYFLIELLRQKAFRNDTVDSAGVTGFVLSVKGHTTLGHSLKHSMLDQAPLATLISSAERDLQRPHPWRPISFPFDCLFSFKAIF